jgi:hypothetical protein
MGINKFIYFLLGCSALFLMVDKQQETIIVNKEEKPIVSFYDSLIYDINTKNVNQIIQSKEAYFYKNMEKIINGTIITRTENTNTNMLSGTNMIKIKDDIYIDKNVHLVLNNSLDLKTEQLEYNFKTKIAKNKTFFKIVKENNTFIGENLYLDGITNHIIAKNIKIGIRMPDDKK